MTELAEAICKKYLGKLVEIYLSEKIGVQTYAEEEIERRAYVVCTVNGFLGNLLDVTCIVETPNIKKEVPMSLFARRIKMIMVKRDDGINIECIG